MNQLQLALINAGLAKPPKKNKRKHKSQKCRVCKEVMDFKEATNIIVCPKCGNYYIFN